MPVSTAFHQGAAAHPPDCLQVPVAETVTRALPALRTLALHHSTGQVNLGTQPGGDVGLQGWANSSDPSIFRK